MMPKTYHAGLVGKCFNRLMDGMVRLGLAPRRVYVLTVRGRKSGKQYSTPVCLVEDEGARWLVSPYGEVSWVRNARVAGKVRLVRGRRSETVSIVEASPEEASPVLKTYFVQNPHTRPYFMARDDSPLGAFEAEASQHPVFRIGGPAAS